MASTRGPSGTRAAAAAPGGAEILAFLVDPRRRRDPYPFYERLRAAGPVQNTVLGLTTVCSMDAALDVLRDPSMSSDPRRADLGYSSGRDANGFLREAPGRFLLRRRIGRDESSRPFAVLQRNLMTHMDGAQHVRVRTAAADPLSPELVRRIIPMTEAIAQDLISGFESSGEAELISEFAYRLPLLVIMQVLGIPEEDQGLFRSWAEDLMTAFDQQGIGAETTLRRGDLAAVALTAYVGALAAQRRLDPREDLLSSLALDEVAGEPLTTDELTAVVAVMLAVGHETTAHLIGNAVWTLHRNLSARQQFVHEPGLGRTAIEELLRYESPVQVIRRFTTRAVEHHGITIPPGRPVMVLLGAANRDPEHFPGPASLDLSRQGTHPIAYGYGAHHCLGAAFASSEALMALRVLYRRLPGLKPVQTKAQWRPSLVFRGLLKLPVRW